MGHKKIGVRLGLSLLALAIVIPLASRVNHLGIVSQEPTKSRSLRADGNPIPPVPPPKGAASSAEVLIADGNPIPPVPPPKGLGIQVFDAQV